MALTSVFYDGPVTETDRAKNRAGAPDYGVYGPDDFKVATHPSIPYALTVKVGRAHGHGVTDTAATDQVVQCATLSGSGAVRYDLIVVRRNWQPLLGGPSTLAAIQGGSTVPNINNLRLKTPGIEDDQPIALVKWQGNQNTPAQIIDLRCWAGNGGMIALDLMALEYLARPGADVLVGNVAWGYVPGANGTWGWAPAARSQQERIAPLALLGSSGWSVDGDILVETFGSGKKVTIAVRVTRTGATYTLSSGGHVSIGTIAPASARGGSNAANYFQCSIVAPGQFARTASLLYANGSGVLSIKNTDAPTVIGKDGSFAFDHTYYIP